MTQQKLKSLLHLGPAHTIEELIKEYGVYDDSEIHAHLSSAYHMASDGQFYELLNILNKRIDEQKPKMIVGKTKKISRPKMVQMTYEEINQFANLTERTEITPEQARAFIADLSKPKKQRDKLANMLKNYEGGLKKFPTCQMYVSRLGECSVWF